MTQTEKSLWRKEEVIAYIEEMILDGSVCDIIMRFYEDYVWDGEFDKRSYPYKKVIHRMNIEWFGR